MKTTPLIISSFFFCLFLLSTSSLQAQRYQKINRPIQVQPIKDRLVTPVMLRPDLVILDQFVLTPSNGHRYIYVKVANVGNLQSAPHSVELRTSWRVDYEHWTTVERFVNFPIPKLAPGASYNIGYRIPDNEIHTNEGFGSNNISFRFFTDKPKNILESQENNNIRTFYAPVLRN